jgi:hypothetical protein
MLWSPYVCGNTVAWVAGVGECKLCRLCVGVNVGVCGDELYSWERAKGSVEGSAYCVAGLYHFEQK